MKLPPHILKMLRGRHGLADDDTSCDAEFRQMDPAVIVRECAGWTIGDPSWVTIIAGWMQAVGAKPEDF